MLLSPEAPPVEDAEQILQELASAFLSSPDNASRHSPTFTREQSLETGLDYEARYKVLIEHIPGVIFVAPLEAGNGEAYVSPQIETILGFSQEEWLGDPLRWYEQVHPEDKLRWSAEAASLFVSGEPLSSTYRVIARNGRVVWFRCDARMVHSEDGKASFIHGIGFDVTELKETEESLKRARIELETRVQERTEALARSNAKLIEEIAERKQTELLLIAAKEAAEASAKLKSEFMANMSHEIRTPMNGVLGLTNLVLNTELTAEQRRLLSVACSSAESLLSIINEVLDFSKLESGKTELHVVDFHLRGNIETLAAGLKVQAEQKGLQFLWKVSDETPDFLRGDWGRLRQVLTNLTGNALKFTKAGSVKLQVAVERLLEPGEVAGCTLTFSVADTGIGMPSSTLKSIFDPFVQADGSITREYGGTGLGLAISKELVAMMGGQIGVISEPGAGSTFSFTANFGILREDVGTRGPNAPPERTRHNRRLRILVAEDNLINQMVVRGVMERFGHSVTLTGNGQEALEAFQQGFDIILMDVQMPVLDGFSATELIRQKELTENLLRTPIIGLSAHALERDRIRCMDAGMDGYVSKPFKADELISLIEELTQQPVSKFEK